MLFNSSEFFLFFAIVYLCYLVTSHRWQNVLLLSASYFFYGYWDYRFLSLILLSTFVDYYAASRIEKSTQSKKRYWLWLSIAVNLGILGFFKYFNFFAENLVAMLQVFNVTIDSLTLDIILPVGISFYTFQTMSYTIDVYRGRQKACKNFLDFSLFVAFFPQLMAGPIERARKLLPQIQTKRVISDSHLKTGAWLILWGLFKKVYIADNLAIYTTWAFAENQAVTSADIYLASFAFIIRFYCDFSGYSDMARGLASLLGFKLSVNFRLPYLSSNPAELWRNWHITMSNWFRDYVYGPLRKTKYLSGNTAIFPAMIAVGFWHGANWTFILYGAAWGIMIMLSNVFVKKIHIYKGRNIFIDNSVKFTGILFTFHYFMITGLLFINPDIQHAWQDIFTLFTDHSSSASTKDDLLAVLFYSSPLIFMQAAQYAKNDLDIVSRLPAVFRYAIYSTLVYLLIVNGAHNDQEFIYFQF